MDDIVVKTKDRATLVQDLEETFANLRKISLKLNPEKCVFGVPSGKLLGLFMSHRGIEANPDKIKAIEQIEVPKRIKDVRRLTGCVAAMSRFISKSAERALPFFKILKKAGPMEWSPEAEAALQDLEETFANLRKINLKLNPDKCVFGVPSGKLLGFFVSQRGIEANPDKIKAIEQIEAPKRIKDVRRLTGCIAAMIRFISKSAEHALPFFKILKKAGPME